MRVQVYIAYAIAGEAYTAERPDDGTLEANRGRKVDTLIDSRDVPKAQSADRGDQVNDVSLWPISAS